MISINIEFLVNYRGFILDIFFWIILIGVFFLRVMVYVSKFLGLDWIKIMLKIWRNK